MRLSDLCESEEPTQTGCMGGAPNRPNIKPSRKPRFAFLGKAPSLAVQLHALALFPRTALGSRCLAAIIIAALPPLYCDGVAA